MAPQCWSEAGDAWTARAEAVAAAARDLERLAARRIEVVDARTSIVCTRRLNDALARGESRFDVDLHAMERLILALAHHGTPLRAVCGKVGGYAKYGPAFGPLRDRLHVVVEEHAERSEYRFPGLGDVAFVRNADGGWALAA